MAVASGIGSQVGVAVESTYGTYVAPTKFIQARKVSVKKVKNTVTTGGLGAGRLIQLGTRRVVTTKAGGGTLECEFVNKGMGLLVQALMGTTVTPVQQASTTAYLQTHTLADPTGKFLTVQAGVPDTTGTVRPYSFLGTKVTGATFTFEVDKEVSSSFELDSRDVTEAQTIVAASYVASTRPFVGTDTSVKVGTFGSEAAVTGVTKATVKIDRALNTDRFYFGSLGLKAEPLIGGYAKITGTISADFVDKTIFADRFASDAGFSLVVEAVGLQISGIYYDTLRITLPMCFLDGDTPVVEGPDIVNGDFPFVCLFDGTNLPKIEVISTDTTL
jgi:hypothetical protein